MFNAVRLVVYYLIFSIAFFIIKKSKIVNKKRIAIISGVIFIILLNISAYLPPIENLFLTFKSPESAIKYMNNNVKTDTLMGKESALVLCHNKNGKEIGGNIIKKVKNGWKFASYTEVKTYIIKLKNSTTLIISKYKDDYYMEVDSFEEINSISDSCGSIFKLTKKYQNKTIVVSEYYSYIKNYDDNYSININGEDIKININAQK